MNFWTFNEILKIACKKMLMDNICRITKLFLMLFPALLSTLLGQTLSDSNLPIVIIATDGGAQIRDEPKISGVMKIFYQEDGKRNFLTNQTNPEFLEYNGRIAIEKRGSSSQWANNLGKYSYGLETLTSSGDNNNVSLFSMPSEHDWILNANVYDKTLIRNMLSYELSNRIGRYAPRSMACEVVLNGDYIGVYVFTEKIKQDKGRVDISAMDASCITGEKLTGGYIFKIDKSAGSNNTSWTSITGFSRYQYEYPSENNIAMEQKAYIKAEVDKLEKIMNGSCMEQWSDPVSGYPGIIDVASFIDQHILHELAANLDMLASSMFYSKERNGKIVSGPIWDHDLGYGNHSTWDAWRTDVFMTDRGQSLADGPSYYQKFMFKDMNYRCQLYKRWQELRQPYQPMATENIMNIIDSLANIMVEPNVREQVRWHTLGNNYWNSPAGWKDRLTYKSEIDYLKEWLNKHLVWLDQNFEYNGVCNMDCPPDLVVNEIMYHPLGDPDTAESDKKYEYIELINAGDAPIQLEGIFFSSGITCIFPPKILTAKDYVVIASDSASFVKRYGFAPFGQYTRDLSNKSDRIILQTPLGTAIDSVFYSDSFPWPDAEKDGNAIALIHPARNNNVPENWKSSRSSPGIANDLVSGNIPPKANAGADQSIILPATSVFLSGSGTDTDGVITSYLWTKVSGDAVTITNPDRASTSITGLVKGSYTFLLTITDNGGSIGTDDVVVVVTSNFFPALVKLEFTENTGTTASNTGTVGGFLTTTAIMPAWSANAPFLASLNSGSIDFGIKIGNYVIESGSVLSQLGGLSAFTITGWVNCRNSTEGPGGNRLVSWINHGGDGVDLVYKSNGSLQVGINEWPDGSPAVSNSGKVQTDAGAPQTNWVFFAMTYNGANISFYFGDTVAGAALDKTVAYNRGAIGSDIGRLAIGHFNSATRSGNLDRMFRGLIDQITIHNAVLSLADIVAVQNRSTSDVHHDRQTTVRDFRLEQNYPNPFNPSTTIGFTLEKKELAKLYVYNMLGQQVATLLDQEMEAGSHKVNFHAGDLPSGVYIYKLITSSEVLMRKAVFMR